MHPCQRGPRVFNYADGDVDGEHDYFREGGVVEDFVDLEGAEELWFVSLQFSS